MTPRAVTAALDALDALTAARAGALPDRDQLAAMRDFPGWGPLASLFDFGLTGAQADHASALTAALDGLDTAEISTTVDTSFYTPTHLIEKMWEVLTTAGFTGGRVLDLGCGTGRFLTHKPAGLAVDYTGVEVEPITAEMAALVHPSADIITGDVAKAMPGSGFDAAIGNVPFASTQVHSSGSVVQMPLHSYCALKAAHLVRPGGYVVLVTSRHLLDSGDNNARNQLAERTNLLGALRLPSRYFASEGTDVVADLLILQVRPTMDGSRLWGTGWTNGQDTVDDTVPVSAYWRQHPDQVAGQMVATGFHQSPLAVRTDDRVQAVNDAVAAVLPNLTPIPAAPAAEQFSDVRLADDLGRQEGSFHIENGNVIRIVDGKVTAVARPAKELRTLIVLREAVDELFAADADWDRTDDDLAPLRARAADLYSKYRRAFGPLNRGKLENGPVDPETGVPSLRWRAPAMGGFRGDPGFWRVLAVENYDRTTGVATPADVLSRRVNRRPVPVTSAADPAEALAISIGEGTGLDLERVAALLNLPDADAAAAALGDLAYQDPASGAWVPARDYLAGQVRRKLDTARRAAAIDPAYTRNVEALEKVQPLWLTPADIRIELGSPMLTAADIEDFAREVLEAGYVTVTYTALAGHWEVDASGLSMTARSRYGTTERSADKLLQDGLNSKMPTVTCEEYDPIAGRSRKVRDAAATEAAVTKLGELADRFAAWVWECPQRAARIEHDYNHRFNSLVPRVADGSRLRLPRLADGVELWPWQRDWVDHALSVQGASNNHEVGMGKTKSAIALAVTLRDLGLANRPMIAVPDHLIEQISAEAAITFPTCRFLVVTRKDLTRDRRRLFAARCASGDWDAVIITHTGFSSIPMPAEYEKGQLAKELDVIGEHMRESGVRSKRLASMLRTTRNRLAKLRENAADRDMITFDQLGVDHISVDEFDRFRRLPITTVSDGFSLGSSTRAFDLYLKVQWLRERNGSRPVLAGYTGTPFCNSLSEAYVLQKFFAPEQLVAAGVEAFDSWAAQFIRFQTVIEVAPDSSGFRAKRRPSVVQNLPELRSMLLGFMMLLRADDVGIERPDARHHTITADPSPVARDYMANLVQRSEALRNRTVTDLTVDNMLKICSDGRAVALDTNLVGLPEYPGMRTKIVAAADQIAQIYRDGLTTTFPGSDVPGNFQFVMCDLGTPHADDSRTYGRLRRLLIERGIPASKIRFVHETTSPQAREALFATCRSGATAVLIGSTAKSGVGVNAQLRAAALHHLDMPWTPASYEQRNGRIVRHGNAFETVDIYTYVTAGTFDGFMAGVVERKARGFAHLYALNSTIREIDDVSQVEMTVAEVKAAATGNPILLRQHELRTKVRALQVARATAMQNAVTARSRAKSMRDQAAQARNRLWRLDGLPADPAAFSALNVEKATSALHHLNSTDRIDLGSMRADNFLASVSLQIRSRLGALELHITSRNRTVGVLDVPSEVRTGGPARIAAWSGRAIKRWLRNLDIRRDELSDKIADLNAAADEADTAADTVTFGRQTQLDELTAELDAVNAEVADVAGLDADTSAA